MYMYYLNNIFFIFLIYFFFALCLNECEIGGYIMHDYLKYTFLSVGLHFAQPSIFSLKFFFFFKGNICCDMDGKVKWGVSDDDWWKLLAL